MIITLVNGSCQQKPLRRRFLNATNGIWRCPHFQNFPGVDAPEPSTSTSLSAHNVTPPCNPFRAIGSILFLRVWSIQHGVSSGRWWRKYKATASRFEEEGTVEGNFKKNCIPLEKILATTLLTTFFFLPSVQQLLRSHFRGSGQTGRITPKTRRG